MDLIDISDKKLLRLFREDPEVVLDIWKEKYRENIDYYNKLCEFIDYRRTLDLMEIINNFLNSNKEIIRKDKVSDNFIGDSIQTEIDKISMIIYDGSTKEVSFVDFKEYLLMVVGLSDEELYQRQMKRFQYTSRPLIKEKDQIYDSLNILLSHIFDLESDGFAFTLEQKVVINTTVDEVKECLEEGDIERAKLKIVALQMLMGLDVRFYPTLKRIIVENIELYKLIDYRKDNGKGRIKG